MCKKLLFYSLAFIILIASASTYAAIPTRKSRPYQRTWEEQLRDSQLPQGLELQAQMAQDTNLNYFGYVEVPKSKKESFVSIGTVSKFVLIAFLVCVFTLLMFRNKKSKTI